MNMKRLVSLSLGFAMAFVYIDGVHARRSDPVSQCQSHKVNAAAIFVKKLFYDQAAVLQNPNYNLDAATQEAEDQFEARWNALEATDRCDFPFGQDIVVGSETVNFDNVSKIMDWIEEKVNAVVGLVLLGVVEGSGASERLGAELLRAGGQKAFGLLKAESQFLHDGNQSKRNRATVRARNTYERTYQKRVGQAQKGGLDVSYFVSDSDDQGTLPDILEATEKGIDDLVQAIVIIFTLVPSPPAT